MSGGGDQRIDACCDLIKQNLTLETVLPLLIEKGVVRDEENVDSVEALLEVVKKKGAYSGFRNALRATDQHALVQALDAVNVKETEDNSQTNDVTTSDSDHDEGKCKGKSSSKFTKSEFIDNRSLLDSKLHVHVYDFEEKLVSDKEKKLAESDITDVSYNLNAIPELELSPILGLYSPESSPELSKIDEFLQKSSEFPLNEDAISKSASSLTDEQMQFTVDVYRQIVEEQRNGFRKLSMHQCYMYQYIYDETGYPVGADVILAVVPFDPLTALWNVASRLYVNAWNFYFCSWCFWNLLLHAYFRVRYLGNRNLVRWHPYTLNTHLSVLWSCFNCCFR